MPVFGKELTASFALALGRVFPVKDVRLSGLSSVVLRSKDRVAESAKTSRFWPRKRMDCGSLLRSL